MFKLHRHKSSDKSGDRIDFKFSNIQVLQVPKGWDKLSVSLISVETGKTISKSRKASVQNGNCRWTEALSESIWISRDDASKELEHCLFKLLVSMGSSRSGILGEATFNLAGYMSSRASILVSLPLKNCNHGTIIRVEIHCLTPRAKLRNEKWKDTNSYKDDPNADYDDTDNKSDASNTFTRSVGSSSYNHLGSTCQPGDLGSGESFSASGSRHSFDSIEGSLGKESFSPQRSFNGVVNNVIGRQDSTGSQNSAPNSPYHVYDSPSSNHSSNISGIPGSARHHQNQRDEFGRISNAIATTPLRNTGSSKNFLEAEEVTIEELGAEARLWERNARKLMLDLEVVRKEFADQSKHLANLDMKLSASNRERDGLKQEIEHLKVFLEESMAKQKATENLKFQAKGMDNIQKELEDEIKFQKESSFNLALQLKKTQESNLELVSILQEMEETIENQKMEIENLSTLESKFDDKVAKYSYGHEDNGEVNLSKEVPDEKMRKASCDSDLEGSTVEHPITDWHPQFEPEDNRNLELQLQQLWESQKTLESTILYLEKTLEEKKHEIEIERDLKAQTLLDCEAEWRCTLTAKEEEIINLEAKLSKALGALDSKTMEFENRSDLIKEIKALKEKVQELERDCTELTDENLELVFKLKESRKDISTGGASFDFSSNEYPANESPSASESEIRKLKSQIDQLELEREEEILIEGVAADQLQIQCIELKNKCTELEIQLQDFKDKAFYLDGELHKRHAEAEEQEIEIGALKQQLECYQGEKTGSKDHRADVCTKFENSESCTAIDMQELFPALCNQLQLLFINLKKHQYTPNSALNTECKDSIVNLDILNCTEPITQKEQVEAILDNLVQLNKLFGAKITVCEDDIQCTEEDIRVRVINGSQAQNELEAYNLKEDALVFSSQGLKSLNEELESRVADLTKELSSKASEIGELKAGHLLKEEEIEALKHRQSDLEIQISDLQETKGKMEENMEIIQREGIISSKCLDNLRNEMIMLSSSMESHVSANKILERKSLELESSKHELELNLSELEDENVHLSERISGLEAQLRYLTDARESSRLELQHSESHVMNLQDDIRRLENEMEEQKFDTKQKWQDMQKRWLEAQEECNYLKKANPKLKATAESLIEECSSLQKSNGELRLQKKELHKHCTVLETELRASRISFSEYSKKIEALEARLSSMLDEIALKEKILTSELDALHHHNKEHKEKLVLEESLLNQMYLEKAIEVENLQLKIAHLVSQISATHGEEDRIAYEAVLEVHSLRADKSRLEAALEEVQGKFEWSEEKLNVNQMECETKVQGLVDELAASKQNQEVLLANDKKLLGLLEDVRFSKEKLEGTVNGLESKLKSSEYERLQLAEENSSLKIQLQKIPLLQDEVLDLKSSLNETEFENERLRTSLKLVSEEYEELKTDRDLFVQKISSMQQATYELENYRRSKVALEEKVLRLEGDLIAQEALCTKDAGLKNELGQVRRANSQFQWKIKCLEEEKEEWLKRAQALEEELKQKKEVKQDETESCTNQFPVYPGSNTTSASIHEELKFSEKKENTVFQFSEEQLKPSMKIDQLQQFSKSQDNQGIVQHQIQVDNKYCYYTGNSQEIAIDTLARIQCLENELAEALEANDKYKAQLKSLLPEEKIGHSDVPKKLKVEDVAISNEENEKKAALLEVELREIRERYFQMSLKYAEVEAEREQLVMKLKAVNGRGLTQYS